MDRTPASDEPPTCERTRFLEALLADEEHGRLQPIEHYLAAFPEVAEFVRSEYATLVLSPLGDAITQGAPAALTVTQVGRYRVLRELARGGMGTVYEAEDPQLERHVVLKALQPAWSAAGKARERLQREARVLGGLDHPHLLKIIDVVDEGGAIFLVMPLVRGRTLAAHLLAARRSASDPASLGGGPRLPNLHAGVAGRSEALRTLLQFFVQVATALQVAHDAGVVHRDLKPENLMVLDDGTPMVLDFGLAILRDEPALTSAGELLGTPLYMAPEQIDGRPVTASTDVFALGVVLYEALTLVHPFAGSGGREATFRRVLEGDPVPLRRHDPLLSRDLGAVVGKAIEREPAARYASAGALAQDLQRVLDLEPTEARPVSGLTAVFRRLGRRPATTVALMLVTMVGLTAAIVLGCYLRQAEKVDSTLRVLGDESRSPTERLEAARAELLRSPNGGRELVPVHPRGDVGPVEAFAWFGYLGVDEQYLPGERLTHRYRIVVQDATGRELWTHDVEQSPDSTWCEVRLETPLAFAGPWQWDVLWLGATDRAGVFAPREVADGPRRFREPVACTSLALDPLPPDLAGLQRGLAQGRASWVLWRSHAESLAGAPQAELRRLRGDAATALGDDVLAAFYRASATPRAR